MKPPPVLTLTDDHRYFLGDRRLPGVTSIINATIPRRHSAGEWHMDRGSKLHRAIHLLAQGKLDESAMDPAWAGRLLAIKKFLADTGRKIECSEIRLHSPSLMYAGTIDALLVNPITPHAAPTLVDWKSSLEPQVAVQLGAYNRLLWDNDLNIADCLALELHEDTTYKCQWFTKAELKRAEQTFCACLTLYGFMSKNNLLLKEEK